MKNKAGRIYSNKWLLIILTLIGGFSSPAGVSAAGDLDNSFGVQGRQVILIPNSQGTGLQWNTAEDIVFQPDGKILVAGSALDAYNLFDFTITRFNTDGTVDSSFANNGVFRHDFFGSDDHGYGIALQPDGKIIMVGEAYLGVFNNQVDTAFGIIRLNSNGSFDSTFGNNGIVITNFFASLDAATEVALQADGKIVATGYATPGGVNVASAYDFALVRYNPNGTLDTTFGTGGTVLTDFNNLGDRAQTSVLQRDGKIVLAGWVYGTTTAAQLDFGLARYNTDGSLDTTFDGDGKVVTTFGTNLSELARDMTQTPDGKLVVAGDLYNPPPFPGPPGHSDVAAARYNPDGSLDASFDGDGRFIYNSNLSDSNEGADGVAVQPDGKILLAGGSRLIQEGGVSHKDLLILRVNVNGSLDNNFGNNGIKLTDFGIFNQPGPPNYGSGRTGDGSSATIGLQRDGKIVTATEAWYGTTPRKLAIARYQNDITSNELPRAKFDFDGDGKSDVAVFRPSNGIWYLNQSTNGFTGAAFGFGTDKLVPADYDGDGKTDVAVYRSGTWYVNRSQAGFTGISFGASDDVPVSADYDGDGKSDLAVFRPSNGTWYFYNLATGQTSAIAFGQAGDKPVPADYDGDGKTDVAVFRSGIWYLQRSALGFTGISFGETSDKPTPADYDGDNRADIAVFRPSNGVWYLQQSRDGFVGYQFGLGTDIPVAADYDGDGRTDIAVFRDGTWYLQRSTLGFTGIGFGAASDVSVPSVQTP